MTGEVMHMPNRDVARQPDGGAVRTRTVFVPRSDICETSDKIVVVAEMPGVAPDDVDITLERRALTVRGHTRQVEHEGYRRVYAEYEDGTYERVFALPEEIDRDNIKAVHRDGVLTLELPKAERARAKKIEVKVS